VSLHPITHLERVTGKIKVGDDEYSINQDFQELVLQLADELNLDELEAAALLLGAEDDQVTLGRSLLECGIIRYHQQRKYLLDCMRLCIHIADDEDLAEDDQRLQTAMGDFAARYIFRVAEPGEAAPTGAKAFVPRCMAAMHHCRESLQKLADRVTTQAVMYAANQGRSPEFRETIEFCRLSLVQQHETLAVLLCVAIEKRHTVVQDFESLLQHLKRADRYDHLLGRSTSPFLA
jgi:nuclear pore complex protein Nup205